MNKLILIGRVIYFNIEKRQLKLRVKIKNTTEEFIINFPKIDLKLMNYIQEKFAFNDLVQVKAHLINSKKTKKLEICADEIKGF